LSACNAHEGAISLLTPHSDQAAGRGAAAGGRRRAAGDTGGLGSRYR
jgi:hypothetical protein